jgi:cytidylate kinase
MKGNIHQLMGNQIRRWSLERQAALEAAREARVELPRNRPIVTVSRQEGSGGTEVAEIVARRLGFELFDAQMIDLIARETGAHRDLVQALDDHTRSGIEQWVDGVLHHRIFTSEDYVRTLGKVLITLARTGSAVVVGRGANFVLAGEPGLHVRTVASVEFRVRRLIRLHGMSVEEAQDRVERSDHERAEAIQRYVRRDIDDPTGYDLVLNLERMGVDQAADLVIAHYGARHS